ncbi:MAG: FeoB-associated Cys-rich membrane protein, partial [Wujia sp.]
MNLSTFLILLVVVAVVGLVIRGMVKDKRAGK